MRDAKPATQIDFRGRTVLVTGAAGGLGRAFAGAFAAAGADVVLADIAADAVREAAQDLAREFREQRISGLAVDVTQQASCDALARQAADLAPERSRIDVLVNNAAIYATLTRAGFHELDIDEWDRVMAVNLKGPFLMARAVRPWMLQAGGSIVNVASATVLSGTPLWAHYIASKAGVIGLTRSMANELGPHGITVNALAPGITLTGASLGLLPDAAGYGATRGAIRRAANADDIVGAALYLASPLAAFMTGQTLVVDGGKQFI
ncbi:SDR family oxidoreductase [Caenimonas sedimenti]|uniref:SDR family oxidoreductase n=2 Tax=Caenimonas sedimenti TaxID=2596921 RepID=A0A562ZY29_9BURK|nr:SDR family oxidoreductase [Caenimonas sedimenti]